jgi:hypothetical protein
MNDETREQIIDLRLEAEALLLEMSLMIWRGHEYGEPVSFQSVLRGHARLTSPDTVRLVKKAIKACDDPVERLALEFLCTFVVNLFVGEQTADKHDRLENAVLRARVRLDGKSVPFRALAGLLANEPDRRRRREIQSLSLGVVKRLNPLQRELWDQEQALPREVGYSYIRLSEAHRHVRLRDLAALAREALDRTERIHLQLLDQQSRAHLGYGADQLRRADVPRLSKNVSVEEYFPADRLVPAAERTARAMGFNLRRMDNLRLFTDDRPNKAPRAMCCPLKVPDDVRLTVRPVGGPMDYRTLFHELGHGLHFASTTTGQFEFQHLGGNAVTETYAFLLEHLVDNPLWLAANTRLPQREIDEFLRFKAFTRIYSMRRYAAKILYELHFHGGKKQPRQAYRRLLSRAYGFDLTQEDSADYLRDIDPTFYTADYLRAWLLEAILTDHLEDRFGRRWFERKAAGNFLARLWESGSQMTADDLLGRLGRRRWTITPWLRRIRTLLRR